jgi:membrane protein required for colicin V production
MGPVRAMNGVDLALAVLLLFFAVRGYWRGFFRESFGFIALVAGIIAALRFTAPAEVLLQGSLPLPPPVPAAVAFVAIFVLVHTLVNLIGAVLDWTAGGSVLRRINGLLGAAFGVGKGAAVLAFLLLFLHLFPLDNRLDEYVSQSSLGPPLTTAASNAIRLGIRSTASVPTAGQT